MEEGGEDMTGIKEWEKTVIQARRIQEIRENVNLERGVARSPPRKKRGEHPDTQSGRKSKKKFPLLGEDWGEEESTDQTPTPPSTTISGTAPPAPVQELPPPPEEHHQVHQEDAPPPGGIVVPPPSGGLGEGERSVRELPDTLTAATTTTVIPSHSKDQEEHAIPVLSQPSHPLLKEDDLVESKDDHKEDRHQEAVRMRSKDELREGESSRSMEIGRLPTPRFLDQDTMDPPSTGGCLQQPTITLDVDPRVETVEQDRVENLAGCSSSHGVSKDNPFVCGVGKQEITVNGIKLSEIMMKRRLSDKKKTTPAKKMPVKKTNKKQPTTPSVSKEGNIRQFLLKKKDVMRKEDKSEEVAYVIHERQEDNNKDNLDVPSTIPRSDDVNTENPENLKSMKLTFSQPTKPGVSSIIEKFRKLSSGGECLFGSGRCAHHNVKLTRGVVKKRVSVKNDQGVVKWVMCDVTSLVCPGARHARSERFGENDSHENDRQPLLPVDNAGTNKRVKFQHMVRDDQSESHSKHTVGDGGLPLDDVL